MALEEKSFESQVIFISGTPCTGKTTLATKLNEFLLKNEINSKLIKINDFAVENNLILGEDPEKFYKIIDIENLEKALENEIKVFVDENSNKLDGSFDNSSKDNSFKDNYSKDNSFKDNSSKNNLYNSNNSTYSNNSNSPKILIVEGHVSHLCKGADKMIILRLNPNKLKKRLEERNYSDSKIQENLEAEALAVCAAETYELYGNKAFEIDGTDKSINDLIEILLNIISNKLNYSLGSIDFMDWFLE